MHIFVVVCYEETIDGMFFHLVKAFGDETIAKEFCEGLPRKSSEIMSTDFDVLRVNYKPTKEEE